MLTMSPPRPSNAASAARIPHRQPSRFTSTRRRTCSSVRSASRPSVPTPALFTHDREPAVRRRLRRRRPRGAAGRGRRGSSPTAAPISVGRTTRGLAVDVGHDARRTPGRPAARRSRARSPAPRRSPHSCPCAPSQPGAWTSGSRQARPADRLRRTGSRRGADRRTGDTPFEQVFDSRVAAAVRFGP